MVIRIGLNNFFGRGSVLLLALVAFGFLGRAIVAQFITGTLIDGRVDATPDELVSALELSPNSGRLFARLAEVESNGPGRNLENAERDARHAIDLAPNNYENRLLLALILEERGDQTGSERATQAALALAPNYSQIRWKLANLELRSGQIQPAVENFRLVANANELLLPAILDLTWSFSKQDVVSVTKLVDGNSDGQILLARFLAGRSRLSEAIDVLSRVDATVLLKSPDFSPLIDLLIKNGRPRAASNLVRNGLGQTAAAPLVWSGGFESETLPGQPLQFTWRFKDNPYARIRIDSTVAHTGSRSLVIDFAGKDTTRLDDGVGQSVVLEPGVNYRLECYVKTQQLLSPDGPRLVVADSTGKWIGTSQPVLPGTADWTPISVNFTAPNSVAADASVVTVSIKRLPHFEYDEPTKGRVWFDDFNIVPVGKR